MPAQTLCSTPADPSNRHPPQPARTDHRVTELHGKSVRSDFSGMNRGTEGHEGSYRVIQGYIGLYRAV